MAQDLNSFSATLAVHDATRLDGLENHVGRSIRRLEADRRLKSALAPLQAATVTMALGLGFLIGAGFVIEGRMQDRESDAFSAKLPQAPSSRLVEPGT